MKSFTFVPVFFAIAFSATTSSVPLPSATCTPGTSYCAGDSTPIILRCDSGFIQPGNCDDNTGEPVNGALCVSYAPAQAYCSVVGSGSNPTSVSPPIVTGTGAPVPPPGNGTIVMSTLTPTPASTSGGSSSSKTSGSGPIQTGAAATSGAQVLGALAVAVLGAVVAL